MPAQLLIEYLDRIGVDYQLQAHPPAYTAVDVAQVNHLNGHSLAKSVMVKLDAVLTMIVVPAHYYLDFELLAAELGAKHAVLATEAEFLRCFPRSEIGAMPAFGHLYGLRTLLVPLFNETAKVAFNACSHSLLVQMAYEDFIRAGHFEWLSNVVTPPIRGSFDLRPGRPAHL